MSDPILAYRSCEDCEKYVYDQDGKRSERFGDPVERPPGSPVPCRACAKLKDIEPKNPEMGKRFGSLSPKNWMALRFYFQVKAGARWPVDSVAAKNLGIIEQLFFYHDKNLSRFELELMKAKR